MDNFCCSNSNVSNLYHNDAIIYRIKKRHENSFNCERVCLIFYQRLHNSFDSLGPIVCHHNVLFSFFKKNYCIMKNYIWRWNKRDHVKRKLLTNLQVNVVWWVCLICINCRVLHVVAQDKLWRLIKWGAYTILHWDCSQWLGETLKMENPNRHK
jgi:hypothetical protein